MSGSLKITARAKWQQNTRAAQKLRVAAIEYTAALRKAVADPDDSAMRRADYKFQRAARAFTKATARTKGR